MPTPQQQADAATKADIALQLETIRLAKQTTLKAIAKQKAETQQVHKFAKQLLAQQIADVKQSLIDAKTKTQQEVQANERTADKVQAAAQEAASDPRSIAGEQVVPEVDQDEVLVIETSSIEVTQSVGQTIAQLQTEVNQVSQVIQTEIADIIQQLGNQINAD